MFTPHHCHRFDCSANAQLMTWPMGGENYVSEPSTELGIWATSQLVRTHCVPLMKRIDL